MQVKRTERLRAVSARNTRSASIAFASTAFTSTVFASVALLGVVLSASGCLPRLSRQPPDRVFFSLEVERGEAARADAPFVDADGDPAMLAVRAFRTAPGFESRQLVYSSSPSRFEADYYHGFFVPVPALLSQLTGSWLRESGLFAGVVEPGSLLDADYVLEGSVRTFHGDYRDSDDLAAVVAIQTFVLRNDDTGAVLLRQADYESRVPVENRSPEALVLGYERAVREILGRLERDLAATDLANAGRNSGASRP